MLFKRAQVNFPSIFASIISTIKHNSSVLVLAQIQHTLVKSSPLRCKSLRFLSARIKICQILKSILNWQFNSCISFESLFIVMTHNSLVNLKLTHFLLWIKGPNKSPNFQTFKYGLVKIFQIPLVIFGTSNQFSFNFCINLDC